jgi:hypothetical protein
MLYGAFGCLLFAAVLGIYALWSHKADLIFSMLMLVLLVAAFGLGYMGARQQLG